MMRGRVLACLAALLATTGVAAQAPTIAERRQSLAAAKRDAVKAEARAAQLARAAAGEKNAAAKAAADERALAARVTAAEADLAAAAARAALIERLLAEQRARLARAQAPVARLLAGLQSLASRPAIVAVAQPGSVDDLVHLRAVLGSALPVVRTRTERVRAALDETRRLKAGAALADRALRAGRARLETERVALARLEAGHRQRALALGRGALTESDRALALGERARDLIDVMIQEGAGQATAADLASLTGPSPRPLRPEAVAPSVHGVFRVPVRGRLVTGFGEISDTGVRSRGLAFAVPPGSSVAAPVGGVIRYARGFRDYGAIVIVDHGDGWTSLVTGLARLAVRPGDRVGQGQRLGAATGGEAMPLTVELRRRGRPIDAAALVG